MKNVPVAVAAACWNAAAGNEGKKGGGKKADEKKVGGHQLSCNLRDD